MGPGLSAGRVQSVATRLIVERERERMAFKRAPYWDVVATLAAPDALGERTEFAARMISLGGKRLAGSKDFGSDGQLTPDGFAGSVRQLDEASATAVAEALKNADFTVMSMETKPYRRRPQPPFTTSTLQQTAGNRLGMGSRAVMRAAQSLYENGYITYMRTDSVTLSQEAITAARNAVSYHFGDKFLSAEPKQYATKTAGAQEAHECIRPAGSRFHDPDELASKLPIDQLRLYTLIWQRTLACQMADATGSTATVRLSAPAGPADGEAVFQASGTVIEFPGFMKATGEGRKPKPAAADARPPISRVPRRPSPMPPNPMLPYRRWRWASGSRLPTSSRMATKPSLRLDTPKPRWSRRWKPRRSAARPPMPASSPRLWIAAMCMSVAVR